MTSPTLPPARRKCGPSASAGPNIPELPAFSRSDLTLHILVNGVMRNLRRIEMMMIIYNRLAHPIDAGETDGNGNRDRCRAGSGPWRAALQAVRGRGSQCSRRRPDQIGARCRRGRHRRRRRARRCRRRRCHQRSRYRRAVRPGRRRSRARDLQRRQQHARQDHRHGRPTISSRAGASCVSAASCSGARPSAAWCRKAQARCCLPAPARRSGAARAMARSIRRRLGLRTLAQAMAKEYASDGIHVGHVVVDGAIGGEKIRHASRMQPAAKSG